MSAALLSKKAGQDEWTKPGAEGGMGAIMKTSQAKDADTLRFTLCDDQDMGDMDADPCW